MFRVSPAKPGANYSPSGLLVDDLDLIFQFLSQGKEKVDVMPEEKLKMFLQRLKQSPIPGLYRKLVCCYGMQLMFLKPLSQYCISLNLSLPYSDSLNLELDEIEVNGNFSYKTAEILVTYPDLEKLTIIDCEGILVPDLPDIKPMQGVQVDLAMFLRGVRHIDYQGVITSLGGLEYVSHQLSKLKILSLDGLNDEQELDDLTNCIPGLLANIPPNLEKLKLPWLNLECFAPLLYQACWRVSPLKNLEITGFRNSNFTGVTKDYMQKVILQLGVSVTEDSGKLFNENTFSRSECLQVVLCMLQRFPRKKALDIPHELRALLVKIMYGDCPFQTFNAVHFTFIGTSGE